MNEDTDLFQASDEEEAVTAAEVLFRLQKAWLNEKFAPELLIIQSEVVDCMLEQLEQMEKNLSQLQKGDLSLSLHRLEMDRISFMINDYLRCRLLKIERFHQYILANATHKLSAAELRFAQSYAADLGTHFETLALQHIPRSSLQSLDRNEIAIKPYLKEYVFSRCNAEAINILLNDDQQVEMTLHSQHLLPYLDIAPYIENGQIDLI